MNETALQDPGSQPSGGQKAVKRNHKRKSRLARLLRPRFGSGKRPQMKNKKDASSATQG